MKKYIYIAKTDIRSITIAAIIPNNSNQLSKLAVVLLIDDTARC